MSTNSIDCGCVGSNSYVDWSQNGLSNPTNYGGYMPGLCDCMSFNGSLFDNSTFANTYGGLGYLGSYGLGYGMGMYGPYGSQQYFDYLTQSQDFYRNYNKRAITNAREDDIELNSPQEYINNKMSVLTEKIRKDDQRHIEKAFDDYVEAFANLYPQYANDPVTLKNRAIAFYNAQGAARTGNPNFSIKEELRQYGKSIFMRKLVNTATCGLFMKGSAEETISELTHSKLSDRDSNQAAMGRAAGVVTLGGGAYGLFKCRNIIWKAASKHPVLAGILAIGTAVGLISSIRSD